MKPNKNRIKTFVIKFYTYMMTIFLLRKISKYLRKENLDPTKRSLLEMQYEMAFITLGMIGWKHPQKNTKLLSSGGKNLFDGLKGDKFKSLLNQASTGAMVEREGLNKF